MNFLKSVDILFDKTTELLFFPILIAVLVGLFIVWFIGLLEIVKHRYKPTNTKKIKHLHIVKKR